MYNHGGDIYSDKRIVMDYSVNLNPLGMPESIKKAIVDNIDSFETYPDFDCRELKKSIAKREECLGYKVTANQIICSNGAAELIYDAIKAIKPAKALIFAPSFGEYEKALKANGCKVEYYFLEEQEGFRLEGKAFGKYIDSLKTNKYDMVILCNPDNPTGNVLKQELMCEIVRVCSDYGTYVLIDECFGDFTNEESMIKSVTDYGNLLVLKAFTKIYSMAGIRLGYGVTSNQGLISKIENSRQCWNVSSVAQVAGVAASNEIDFVYKTREYVKKERTYLVSELIKLGFKIYGDACNYVFFHCDMELYSRLYAKGILIRDCSNYKGLEKGFYRIGIKSHKDNEFLIHTIREML